MESSKPELNVNAKLGLAGRWADWWRARNSQLSRKVAAWLRLSSQQQRSPSVLLLRKHLRFPCDTNKRLFSNSRSASAEAKSCQTLASCLSRAYPQQTDRMSQSLLKIEINVAKTNKLQFLECDGLSDLVSSVFLGSDLILYLPKSAPFSR